MIAFTARSHGYKAGAILLTFVSILFLAGFASPYWAVYDVPDWTGGGARSTDVLHEGLFSDCFSGGKTPSRCESFSFQDIAGWLHGVRALEALTMVVLITAVAYAVAVNFCRSQPEPRYRLLEILAGVGGVLGLIGVIVYAATRKDKAHTFDTFSVELGFRLPRSNAYYYGWSLYLAGIGTAGSIIACILIAVFNEKFEDDRLADIDTKSDYSRSSRSEAGYYPRRAVAQGGYGHEREGYMRHDRDEEEDERVSRGGKSRYDDPWDASARDNDIRRSKEKMVRSQDGPDYKRSKGSMNNMLDDDPVDDKRRSKGHKRQDESDARRSKGSLDRLDDDDDDDRRPFRDDTSYGDEFKSWSHDGDDSDVRRCEDDDDRRRVGEKRRRDDRHAREDDREARRGEDSQRRSNGRESGDYKRRDDEFRRQDDREYFRRIVDFEDDDDYRPESERDHSISSDDRRRQPDRKSRRDKVYPREAENRRQEGDYRPVRRDEEDSPRQTKAEKKRQSERGPDANKSQEDLEEGEARPEGRRRRRRSRSRENVRQSGEFTRQNGDYAPQGAEDLPHEEKVGKWLVDEVYAPPKGTLGIIYGKNLPKPEAESAV